MVFFVKAKLWLTIRKTNPPFSSKSTGSTEWTLIKPIFETSSSSLQDQRFHTEPRPEPLPPSLHSDTDKVMTVDDSDLACEWMKHWNINNDNLIKNTVIYDLTTIKSFTSFQHKTIRIQMCDWYIAVYLNEPNNQSLDLEVGKAKTINTVNWIDN